MTLEGREDPRVLIMFYFLILVAVKCACLLFKYSLDCMLITLCICCLQPLKLETKRMHEQEPN